MKSIDFLEIMLFLYTNENAFLLIDGIETSLYTDVLDTNWKIINEASKKFNTQIFATTHSLETIQSFTDNVADEDVALYRLDNDRAVRSDRKTFYFLLEQGFDVR